MSTDTLPARAGYEPIQPDLDIWPNAVAGYGYTGQLAEQVMQREVALGLTQPYSGRYQDGVSQTNRQVKTAAGIDEPYSCTTMVRFLVLERNVLVIDGTCPAPGEKQTNEFWSGDVSPAAAEHFREQARQGRVLSGLRIGAGFMDAVPPEDRPKPPRRRKAS